MDRSECRKRSLAAEAAGDEAKALYWAQREAAFDNVSKRTKHLRKRQQDKADAKRTAGY